jgi:very-short-patch-repair endonuclease
MHGSGGSPPLKRKRGPGGVMKYLRNDPALKERRRELRRHQTDAERAFWACVRNRQFLGMRFFRQYSVGSYILDFYCPAIMLAVELDGSQHNQPEGREYDAARSEYLHAHGIEVIRFWNNEILHEIEGVLARLEMRVNVRIREFVSR